MIEKHEAKSFNFKIKYVKRVDHIFKIISSAFLPENYKVLDPKEIREKVCDDSDVKGFHMIIDCTGNLMVFQQVLCLLNNAFYFVQSRFFKIKIGQISTLKTA